MLQTKGNKGNIDFISAYVKSIISFNIFFITPESNFVFIPAS